MHITLIQTGGTIDKDYPANDTNHGYHFEVRSPAFLKILERVNPMFSFDTLSVLKKDSLDITDDDREKIYDTIASLEDVNIVVTHGTDTIRQTAERLSSIENKTIVLTGAFLPEKFYDSDAEFNLGIAIAGVQLLPNGIFIALNGIIVPWDKFPAT